MSIAEVRIMLAENEQLELEACEATIAKGIASFADTGSALMAIRSRGLYRATHATFKDYMLERWGLSGRRGYQMIEAAAVVENVKNYTLPPAVESQARSLAILPPEKQADAWVEAIATAPAGKITAKHVEAVVERYVEPKPEKAAKPAPKFVPDRSADVGPEDFGDEPGEDFPSDEPPTKPVGKSRVNGEVVDDPPEIAAKRAAGKLGPNVVPVITTSDSPLEPSPGGKPDREPGDHEPETDEEWLQMLPAYQSLRDARRRSFMAQALMYRSLAPAVSTFKHHVTRAFTVAGRGSDTDPYGYKLNEALKVNDPSQWTACPPLNHGGCDGIGQVDLGGLRSQCKTCYGRGYLIN